MTVDQTSLDRIRNATFPASRRGYDKREVEKFLNRLADWLETGGGDQARSDTVKKELERVGQRTGAILAQAEESAQSIRAEAEAEAQNTIGTARATAEQSRDEAESYAQETRQGADQYAEGKRRESDERAAAVKTKAAEEADERLEAAKAQARRIVEEGVKRRRDIEAVISDLVRRRDDVLDEAGRLSATLADAIKEHKPSGPDPFAPPDDLDAGEVEAEAPEEELEDEEAGEDEPAEPDTGGGPDTAEGPKSKRTRVKGKGEGRRSGKRGRGTRVKA
jgi:DivIVA domain-containing protein